MYQLMHLPLAPHSRYARLVMAEKGLEAEIVALPGWGGATGGAGRPLDFADLSPDGDLPTLRFEQRALHGAAAIVEFLEETGGGRRLLPVDAAERAETRRLASWFTHRLYEDAARPLIEEKLVKMLRGGAAPDSARVREGASVLRRHLALIDRICDRRQWLAGEELTIADFAAAAPLSSLDYIDCVAWEAFPHAKAWYALVKCRPAFRPLLSDRAPGMPPAPQYQDLDF